MEGVSMDRFNVVGKTSYKVNRMLKLGVSLFANRRKNTDYPTDKFGMSNPVYYSRKANPYFELYDKDGNYNYDYDIQNNTDTDLKFNIFEERRNTSLESVVNSFSSIFDAELRFNDKLKITSQFGYQLDKASKEEIADWDSYAMRSLYKRVIMIKTVKQSISCLRVEYRKSTRTATPRLPGKLWESIVTALMIFMSWK